MTLITVRINLANDNMRILGIDYGDKNIGVAICDPLMLTAQSLEVIRRSDERNIKPCIARIAEIVEQYDVKIIVLGYPKNMDNSEGFRCEKTLEFKERLVRRFQNMRIPVELWDERLSTMGADRSLTHLSKDKRDSVIDKMAAVFILQGYLDKYNAEKNTAIATNNEQRNKHTIKLKRCNMSEINGVPEIDDLPEFEDLEEAYETVVLTDDNGDDVEFTIIDAVKENEVTYLLMIESENFDDESAEASIFKEVAQDGEDSVYELVEEDEEFERVAALFQSENDEYELEL